MKYLSFLILALTVISCTTTKTEKGKNTVSNLACFKEIQASHFITSKYMSLEEDLVVDMETKGLILELISETSNTEKAQQRWNKVFYKDLPHHYLMTEDLEKAASILNISGENVSSGNDWPSQISQQEYDLMYKALSVDLVAAYEVPETMKGKYVITPNKEFWDITTDSDYPLLVDILSTYERSFDAYELIHDNQDSALNYAIIIFDALSSQRNPDNPFYYNKLVLEQIPSLSQEIKEEFQKLGIDKYTEFPIFNLNYYNSDRKAEYAKILNSQQEELAFTKKVYTKLPKPPFFIVKVNP